MLGGKCLIAVPSAHYNSSSHYIDYNFFYISNSGQARPGQQLWSGLRLLKLENHLRSQVALEVANKLKDY